jgi:hypothetical protein
MYACISEIGHRFFEGVCALSNQVCISTDPPPPCCSWIASCLYCLRLSRFLPLTGVNVYSLCSHILCLAINPRAGKQATLRSHRGIYPGFWIRSSESLPSTTFVNEGKREGRDVVAGALKNALNTRLPSSYLRGARPRNRPQPDPTPCYR